MSDFDQPSVPPLTPPLSAPPAAAPPVAPPPVAPPAEPQSEVGADTDESPGDPFEGWPAAQSASVIEEAPPDGASVEHVRGEVEVPDGFTTLEGTPLGNQRSVGVVVSRFNGGVTNKMLQSALEALVDLGVAQDAITVMPVPGAFELPLAAMALAKTRRYACIVALGAIVRGDTPHFEYVASECASGLQLAGIETGVPVSFGVLTVENVEQAEARIHKAAEAVRSALEMADLFARLRASARQ
jgi:6,7-dimethyl-8-ribityllumazine synthase